MNLSGSRRAVVFGLHVRRFFLAARKVRFQCEAARQLQLSARGDAVMQSTSVLLYSVSADKAGSFDKAKVLEDINSRRTPVPVFFSDCYLVLRSSWPKFVRTVRVSEVLTPVR